MPFREVSVRYEYPTCSEDRDAFKAKHSKARRRWVSTAVVDGVERMKFSRFEEYDAYIDLKEKLTPARAMPPTEYQRRNLQKFPGHDSKGRAEWDR